MALVGPRSFQSKNICCFRRVTYAINCFYKLISFLQLIFAVYIKIMSVYTEDKRIEV